MGMTVKKIFDMSKSMKDWIEKKKSNGEITKEKAEELLKMIEKAEGDAKPNEPSKVD